MNQARFALDRPFQEGEAGVCFGQRRPLLGPQGCARMHRKQRHEQRLRIH